jgi:hypothetical protein
MIEMSLYDTSVFKYDVSTLTSLINSLPLSGSRINCFQITFVDMLQFKTCFHDFPVNVPWDSNVHDV